MTRVPLKKLRAIVVAGVTLLLMVQDDNHSVIQGYLLDWQFRLLGTSYDLVTMLMQAAACLTPWFVVEQILVRTRLVTTERNRQQITWRGITAVTAIISAVTAAGYLHLAEQYQETAEAKIIKVDWSRGIVEFAEEAQYVELSATLPANLTFTMSSMKKRKTRLDRYYHAVVPDNWQPGQPVPLILVTDLDIHDDRDGNYSGRNRAADLPTRITAKLLHRNVPIFIRSTFLENDTRIAGNAWFAEAVKVRDGRVTPNSDYRSIILAAGGTASLIVPIGMFVSMRNSRRRLIG